MRILDALSALLSGKPKKNPPPLRYRELSTVWSEKAAPDETPDEYPRPQLRRKSWICLNGSWDYAINDQKDYSGKPDGKILVPFSPECRRSGVGRRLNPGEYLWYQRTVELAGIPEDQRLLLHFGAVDQTCSVWWNGNLLGSHRNGYLPFSFDVTDYLTSGTNTILVRVQDDTDHGIQCRGKQTLNPHGMFYTAQSGIWQTVWMEWVPGICFENLRITPLFDEGAVLFDVTLTEPDNLSISMKLGGEFFCHHIRKREFAPGSSRITKKISIPGFQAWSPEKPFLYSVQLSSSSDEVQSYFAMRKFSVGTDAQGHPRLMLNNRPYFFHGVLDQGYWPESLYTPPCDAAMVHDILKMKEFGFNTIRKHIKIEPLRWYYHCDRLGMVVWQDMVSGGGKISMFFSCYLPTAFPWITKLVNDRHYFLFSRSNQKGRRQWEKDCMETVRLLYNCPCIGMWVPFNEGWGQFDAVHITNKIKKADSTRLVDHASGWFDQGGGDVRSVHNYFRPLKVEKDNRPFILSEYGGLTCAVSGHLYCSRSYGYHTCQDREEFTGTFDALRRKLQELEEDGLSGAVYTQVSDVEEEINGLLTYDRKVEKLLKR